MHYTHPSLNPPSFFLNIILSIIFISAYSKTFYIKNHKFYDSLNAQIMFHGVNVVQKIFPYYRTNFNQTHLQQLKQLGINGLRVGVMWPGVEPQEGKYNESYLKKMVEFVDLAGKYGIYSLVEFHQDLFSDAFCSQGVPGWAIRDILYKNFPFPLFNPQNLTDKCQPIQWQKYYFTYSVNQAFLELYENFNGLLDKFSKYWKKVANAFQNNPYVIGYELINQPWPGNIYKQPYLLMPGISEMFHLQALYDRIAGEIQSIDFNQNIAVQPVTWVNAFPIGLTHAPGANITTPSNQSKKASLQSSTIISFHYYSPPILDMDNFLYARKLDMERLNMGGLLTQFLGTTDLAQRDMDVLDRCQEMGIGWFAWEYGDGLQVWILKRTYAQRIAGTKQTQKFDNITKQYSLTYKASQPSGKTIIYFSYSHYLYGMGNITDPQRNLTIKNPYKYTNKIPTQQLNMQIKIFPSSLNYTIVDNMYVVINSKGFDGKQVFVNIRRKEGYGVGVGEKSGRKSGAKKEGESSILGKLEGVIRFQGLLGEQDSIEHKMKEINNDEKSHKKKRYHRVEGNQLREQTQILNQKKSATNLR